MAHTLTTLLRSIDYQKLPISDYNKRYIARMMPALDYYMDIYLRGLRTMLSHTDKALGEVTLVDYGGGHGFLSLLAKEQGIGRVVYVDFNPDSVATVKAVGDSLAAMGHGRLAPDDIVTGDAHVLRAWCEAEGVVPDIVMGMDVIEHIYCLDDFFADLLAVAPHVNMLFTTASTPYNRRVVRRLHAVMMRDEEVFRGRRRSFIQKHYPNFAEDKLDYWAIHTRGLNYDDILRAVDSETPNLLCDPYNTCDPDTGSWTERILPIGDYRTMLQSYGYGLQEENGFYNEYRGGLKGWLSRRRNRRLAQGRCRRLAPFLYLIAAPAEDSADRIL